MIFFSLALLLTGLLLVNVFFKKPDPLEAAGFGLLFSITAVPWAAVNVALLTGRYVSAGLLLAVGAVFLLLLSGRLRPAMAAIAGLKAGIGDASVIVVFVLLAVGANFHYSDVERLLSLASYLHRGEAKCFYMQSFALVEGLSPASAPDLKQFHQIISAPGNSMFPAALTPVFGPNAFRFLYVAFTGLIFLFVFQFVWKQTGLRWAALGAALFSVLNPYYLSVEVLDRNVIALALSAALLYAVAHHTEKPLLHGLLFGIAAGTGLRFLPLTLAAPILLTYYFHRRRAADYLLFLGGFAVVFAFNVPHLSHHGFHSLGETKPLWNLFADSYLRANRTPFLPYPNSVFYLANCLNWLGIALAAVLALGAFKVFREDKKLFLFLVLSIFPSFLAISSQRDWIEGDKIRILLWVFFPLSVFAGYGAVALAGSENRARRWTELLCLMAAMAAMGRLFSGLDVREDRGTFARKPIYQSETPVYRDYYRRKFSAFHFLPNYERLHGKTRHLRKRLENRLTAAALFIGANGKPSTENPLVASWFSGWEPPPPPTAPSAADFANLSIDLEKLVLDQNRAVSVSADPGAPLANFEDREGLLDVYYKEANVAWQPEILPVVIFTEKPELLTFKELYVDLNAFIGFGRDADGFERVNQIDFAVRGNRRDFALSTGLTALPQTDRENTLLLRIPTDVKVIVRNWIVDGKKGVPHRIDSWEVRINPNGRPTVDFYCFEPESYL